MRSKLLVILLLCATVTAAQQTSPGRDGGVAVLHPKEVASAPLVIYPNPTSGTLFVNWGGRSLHRMPVEVRALDGRLLIMDSLSPENTVDVGRLEDGTYRLLLLDLTGVRAERIFQVIH